MRRNEILEPSTKSLFDDLDTPDELPPVKGIGDIEIKEYQTKS